MGTYVLLVKLTEQGKARIKEALERRQSIMEYVQKLGGSHKGVYMTFGRYDVIEIIELPDDAIAMKLAIKAAETGDVQVETLHAFTQSEMENVVGSL